MNKPREIDVPNAPEIEGLSFRHFNDVSDFPKMMSIFHPRIWRPFHFPERNGQNHLLPT